MNAFQLIAMSVSLDLSGFFEEENAAERKTSIMSMYPAKDIIERIDETARNMGFELQKKKGKLMLRQKDPKSNRNGQLSVATEVFEVNPCLHVVELRKCCGDRAPYKELCRELSSNLSSEDLSSPKVNFDNNSNIWRSDSGLPAVNNY